MVGGLGNQLFEYAMARALSISNSQKLYLNASNYRIDNLRKFELGFFNIEAYVIMEKRFIADPFGWIILFIAKHIFTLTKLSVIEMQSYGLQDVSGIKYARGFWQNKEYFKDIEDVLKNELTINTDRLPEISRKKYFELKGIIEKTNSVAIHIRRTDYLSQSNDFCVLDISYYSKAISYVIQHVHDPIFYVFSDDISWCKKQDNLFGQLDVVYIDDNVDYSDIVDFALMECCNHFIIANSTYSWWASFLGKHSSKLIVSPKCWVQDVEKNEIITHALLEGVVLL